MITNVLADGSEVESVKGVQIDQEQFPQVYKVVEELEENK